MAAYAHLKNEFTKNEKCHTLMTWLTLHRLSFAFSNNYIGDGWLILIKPITRISLLFKTKHFWVILHTSVPLQMLQPLAKSNSDKHVTPHLSLTCGKTFSSKRAANRHIAMQHQILPDTYTKVTIPNCPYEESNKRFDKQIKLTEHMNIYIYWS